MKLVSFVAFAAVLSLAAAEWTALGTWSGTGAKQTPSFTTTQREWRVRWTVTKANPQLTTSLVSITVMDGKDALVTTMSDSQDGESYVRAASGSYYLQIAGVNAKWTVTAEETAR